MINMHVHYASSFKGYLGLFIHAHGFVHNSCWCSGWQFEISLFPEFTDLKS